jgi:hypothetical protein
MPPLVPLLTNIREGLVTSWSGQICGWQVAKLDSVEMPPPPAPIVVTEPPPNYFQDKEVGNRLA